MRPLPSPAELRAFAERVAAEREREIMAGDPDALAAGPIVLRPAGETEREYSAAVAASVADADAKLATWEAANHAAILADPARAAQLAELIARPPETAQDGPTALTRAQHVAGPWRPDFGRSDDAGRRPAPGAAPPNLDSEGFSQRTGETSRFSQQFDGALALAPDDDATPAAGTHDGHGCCKDETIASTMTLVGQREVWDVDEQAMTYTTGEAIAIALACRCWRCVCCKYRLRDRNRARAIRGALRASGCTWFVTITLDRRTELYRRFRDAELSGLRVVIAPGRKRRRRPADLVSTRFLERPRLIGARKVPATALLGGVRGVIEPGGRLLAEPDARAETLISIRYQAQAWNRLRLMLERHFGHRVEYFKALELHPGDGGNAGIAHLHLLVRTGSVAEWWMRYQGAGSWRAMLARAGFGVVTKVELVKSSEAAARYVTKMTAAYTTKDMADLPRWSRRGAWSRDWSEWRKATPIAGFHWQLARMPRSAVVDALAAVDFKLLDPADFRIPATAPP